jgi:hypothetical protein
MGDFIISVLSLHNLVDMKSNHYVDVRLVGEFGRCVVGESVAAQLISVFCFRVELRTPIHLISLPLPLIALNRLLKSREMRIQCLTQTTRCVNEAGVPPAPFSTHLHVLYLPFQFRVRKQDIKVRFEIVKPGTFSDTSLGVVEVATGALLPAVPSDMWLQFGTTGIQLHAAILYIPDAHFQRDLLIQKATQASQSGDLGVVISTGGSGILNDVGRAIDPAGQSNRPAVVVVQQQPQPMLMQQQPQMVVVQQQQQQQPQPMMAGGYVMQQQQQPMMMHPQQQQQQPMMMHHSNSQPQLYPNPQYAAPQQQQQQPQQQMMYSGPDAPGQPVYAQQQQQQQQQQPQGYMAPNNLSQ